MTTTEQSRPSYWLKTKWRAAKGIKELAAACDVPEEDLPDVLCELMRQGELNESWKAAFRSMFQQFSAVELNRIARDPSRRELLQALDLLPVKTTA